MDTTISRKNQSLLFDAKTRGLDTGFWKKVSGAATASTSGIVLNAASISSYASLRNGDVEFGLTVPTAPTAGDARYFGVYSQALGTKAKILFSIEGAKIYCLAHDDAGTVIFKNEITWSSAYTNAEALYRISWGSFGYYFSINGTIVYRNQTPAASENASTLPCNVTLSNTNADAMIMSYVAIRTSADLDTSLVGQSTSSSSGASAGSGFAIQGNGYIAKPAGGAGLDATTTFAAATQILVSGLSFAFGAKDIAYITQIPTSGDATTYTDKADFAVSGSIGSQTITVTGAAFAATDTFEIGITGERVAYDKTGNVNYIAETNPLNLQYVVDTFTLTNVPAATDDITSLVNCNGYKAVEIQITQTGGTATFAATAEASLEGVLTTNTWLDVTAYAFTAMNAATAASYTANCMLRSNPDFSPVGLRVRINAAGDDTGDFLITFKRFY